MHRKRFGNQGSERLLAGLLVLVLLTSSLLTAQAKVRHAPTIDSPGLISPSDGSETTGNPDDPLIASRDLHEPLGIPTFEWEDVGAIKYELEVATTAAFGASRVVKDLNNLEYTTFTPNGDKEEGSGFSLTEESGEFTDAATFYWQVRAWDDNLSAWSEWSPTWSFVRHWGYQPELVSPGDETTQSQTPYFTWEPVPGASFYQVQVDSSDAFGTLLEDDVVDMPVFTPVDTFENDTDLFWRVRAFHRPNSGDTDGGYGGPWSEVREFEMAWSSKISASDDKRPLQLIPVNNATYVNRPLFCWQPVTGAKKYAIDISTHPQFVSGSFIIDGKTSEDTCYVFDRDNTFELDTGAIYYWRVRAWDARSFLGQSTDDGVGSAAFRFTTTPSATTQMVPSLFYPLPYYTPIMSDTFDDPTVAIPTFMWDHVTDATAYELRLDDDQAMLDPPTVIVTTTNTSFTFTDTASYPLNDGQVYYWKVRARGAPCGAPTWSQMYDYRKACIDTGRVETAATVKLIQPTYQTEGWSEGYKYGQQSVTYYPNFAWTAIAPTGDATYQIQIAYEDDFDPSDIVHDAQTGFVEYTPTGRPESGTYFWRVRRVAPTTGDWSETGRFIVSRNFTYCGCITVDGDPSDWGAIPNTYHSPPGENGDGGAYDMSGFYITNDSYDWKLGIYLPPSAKLGLYFDIDHLDQSGANAPPAGKGEDPNPPQAHRPEYAIYLSSSDLDGSVHAWDGSSAWTNLGTLGNIGASAAYSSTAEFLEIKIPVDQIGSPGSLSIMMFSMDGSDVIQDRLPNLPGEPTLPAFLTESTTPTPLLPANAPQDESLAKIEHNTPVLTWRHNEAGSTGTLFFQTWQDEHLSNLYEDGNSPNMGWFWDHNTYWAPTDFYQDNNSYHWNIQRGGFNRSMPNHFRKASYVPIDLQFSPLIVSDTMTYTNRTPSFSWQPSQSAPRYFWELWQSGQRVEKKDTMVPYYTHPEAIQDGTYTWKVYARDPQNELSAEVAQGEFRKVSDVVPVLEPEVTARTLILRWEPVDYAAYYKIEIADDPQFSSIADYTTWNTTFTPRQIPSAVEDGSFYWRVYTYDNSNYAGPWIDLHFDPYAEKIYLPMVLK